MPPETLPPKARDALLVKAYQASSHLRLHASRLARQHGAAADKEIEQLFERRAELQEFHRFLVTEAIRPDDPMQTIDGPRNPGRSLPKILSEAEIERLIASAEAKPEAADARLCAMVELL